MKSIYIILGIVVLAVIVGGAFILGNDDSSSSQSAAIGQESSDNGVEESAEAVTSSDLSRYTDYSESSFATATENNGKAVLFFAALAWCPSCQAADKDIQANFDKVPSDVTILKVDYDTAKDLKQKYAITMQDTFVQVDSKGDEITRWNSGGQGVLALLENAK